MTTHTLAQLTSQRRYPDPAKRWTITKRAMLLYLAITEVKDSASREEYDEWINSLDAVTTDDEYRERIEQIRDRAREDHESNGGENCEAGTTAFLDVFGIEQIEITTDKCVAVTVRLHFHISNNADEDQTRNDVQRYLRVDVSGNVDNLDDLEDFEIEYVEVNSAE